MAQQFFYDEQIRRFLLQFTRIFSNFQVEYGPANSDQATLLRVPVRYGDWSRLAQTVQQDNSASSLPATPIMTFYITGMDYDRPRMQEPYFIDRTAVRQRYYDSETDSFETSQGNAFTIERLMPVPYKMTLTLDIWTSNTNQKFQIFEQIATLFNPALEIQSTESYLDWTSLSVVNLESTRWTDRTIPQGSDNPIDIMTMTFSLPIWISSPAMVKKLGVVEKIIMSVYDAQGDAAEAIQNSDLLLGTRQKFTPYNYQVLLIGNKLQALKYSAVVDQSNSSTTLPDTPPSNEFWPAILEMYNGFRPGITQIRLDNQWGTNDQVIATATIDPTDERFLLLDIDADTLPQDTLPPIDAVIDPLLSGPGAGLPAAITGQRYLILNDIGNEDNQYPAESWGSIIAKANDIIQYNGTMWEVIFGSTTNTTSLQYVTNITTDLQYLWTGQDWVKSYEGLYPAGEWSIVI
jgi:hypothetical protein